MSTEEAAEYLGIHVQTLMYHRRRGHIEPYKTSGLAFTPRMLDEFRERFQVEGGSGMTKKEVAEAWNCSASLVQYYMNKGDLNPIGKRKQAWIFDPADVEKVLGPMPEGE
jgi:DNA-binding transcriptional MerR regulator